MKTLLVAAVASLLAACGGGSSAPTTAPLAVEPSVKVPAYQIIGAGPLVVVLAQDMQDTLNDPRTTGGIVPDLISAGYSVMSLDLPCHGADAEAGIAPLDCWASRLASGDQDMFLNFCSGVTDALDAAGVTEASILGISRGGYVATVCAAYEPRFTKIVLEIPVTDLNYLTEFKAHPVDESLYNLTQYIPYLTDRRKMLSIDAVDVRVGAALAEAFAKQMGATLEVTDSPNHTISSNDAAAAVQWLMDQHP